ncbi:MAG: alpha/beta fold hydrolase [Actinomycetota bacterium]
MARRQDVEFLSSGAVLRGWLYMAAGEETPGIVMTHGLSAVKEMFLDEYARAFAEAGFTTLVYDHFGFGASDGEPRQSPSPNLQQQGYRDAVAWLSSRPTIDPNRIAIWGTSFSGGHVISLTTEDLPITAAVAQVPFLSKGAPRPPAGMLTAFGERASDAQATVPATTETEDGVGAMFLDGAHDWFTSIASKRAPAWRNELLISGFLESASWSPFEDLSRSNVPLLVIAAANDTLTPPAALFSDERTLPLVEVVLIPGNHFDAYEAGFDESSSAAIRFLKLHLQK